MNGTIWVSVCGQWLVAHRATGPQDPTSASILISAGFRQRFTSENHFQMLFSLLFKYISHRDPANASVASLKESAVDYMKTSKRIVMGSLQSNDILTKTHFS